MEWWSVPVTRCEGSLSGQWEEEAWAGVEEPEALADRKKASFFL